MYHILGNCGIHSVTHSRQVTNWVKILCSQNRLKETVFMESNLNLLLVWNSAMSLAILRAVRFDLIVDERLPTDVMVGLDSSSFVAMSASTFWNIPMWTFIQLKRILLLCFLIVLLIPSTKRDLRYGFERIHRADWLSVLISEIFPLFLWRTESYFLLYRDFDD